MKILKNMGLKTARILNKADLKPPTYDKNWVIV
jgi:hypothetical protein